MLMLLVASAAVDAITAAAAADAVAATTEHATIYEQYSYTRATYNTYIYLLYTLPFEPYIQSQHIRAIKLSM